MFGAGEGAQSADEQQVLLDGGFSLVVGEAFGGLQHGGAGGVAGVVGDDAAAVGGDGLALGAQREASSDEFAAAGEELDVDVGEGFEAGAELGLGAADAACHRAYAAVTAGEEGDDPVRLAQLLGAQHDAVVAEQTHGAHSRLRHRRPGPDGLDCVRGAGSGVRPGAGADCGRAARGVGRQWRVVAPGGAGGGRASREVGAVGRVRSGPGQSRPGLSRLAQSGSGPDGRGWSARPCPSRSGRAGVRGPRRGCGRWRRRWRR